MIWAAFLRLAFTSPSPSVRPVECVRRGATKEEEKKGGEFLGGDAEAGAVRDGDPGEAAEGSAGLALSSSRYKHVSSSVSRKKAINFCYVVL